MMKLSFFIWLLCLSAPVFCQDTLRGTVVSDKGEPLRGAGV